MGIEAGQHGQQEKNLQKMPRLVLLDGHEEKDSKRRKERGGKSINLAMGSGFLLWHFILAQ